MREQLRVYSAAVVGLITPTLHGIFNFAEPILKLILLLGQVGVTAVTILYIVQKWRNARNKNRK